MVEKAAQADANHGEGGAAHEAPAKVRGDPGAGEDVGEIRPGVLPFAHDAAQGGGGVADFAGNAACRIGGFALQGSSLRRGPRCGAPEHVEEEPEGGGDCGGEERGGGEGTLHAGAGWVFRSLVFHVASKDGSRGSRGTYGTYGAHGFRCDGDFQNRSDLV